MVLQVITGEVEDILMWAVGKGEERNESEAKVREEM